MVWSSSSLGNTIEIMTLIISWSSFPNVVLSIQYNNLPIFQDASIKKMMKSLDSKIENLTIFALYNNNLNKSCELKENIYDYVIKEYGANIETYGIFKLLVSTNLINSLKRVSFEGFSKVDFKLLHDLAERGGVSDLFSKIEFYINKPKSN